MQHRRFLLDTLFTESNLLTTNLIALHIYIVLVFLGKFIGIFLGSFILGTSFGILSAIFLKVFQLREQPIIETSFFVIISYLTFPLAEAIELTGIVAILFCGIAQSHYTYINLSIESRERTKQIFEFLSFLSENFLFSYMGVSLFTFPYHQWKPGFIVFSFIGIAVGRILNIIPISLFLNIRRRRKIPWTFQAMLLFSGLFQIFKQLPPHEFTYFVIIKYLQFDYYLSTTIS